MRSNHRNYLQQQLNTHNSSNSFQGYLVVSSFFLKSPHKAAIWKEKAIKRMCVCLCVLVCVRRHPAVVSVIKINVLISTPRKKKLHTHIHTHKRIYIYFLFTLCHSILLNYTHTNLYSKINTQLYSVELKTYNGLLWWFSTFPNYFRKINVLQWNSAEPPWHRLPPPLSADHRKTKIQCWTNQKDI